MTLFGYRLGVRLSALLGLLSLGLFLFGTDPDTLSSWGLALFFLSLFVAVSGLASLLLFSLGERFLGAEGVLGSAGSLLRQSVLIGLLVLGLTLLLYFSVFAWWSALLLVSFFLLVEFTIRKLIVNV